jgi:Zn-dependent peptidase ImmA (M78 family)/transcriptional regulator with XRE-family HTH domain
MTMADRFNAHDGAAPGVRDQQRLAAEISALFSPARLRLAREYRGLTQTALAASAGISSAAISQFEKLDGNRPAPTTLLGLAEALDFSLSFFAVQAAPSSRRSTDLADVGGFFRSLRSFSVTDRRRALAVPHCVRDLADALERRVQLPHHDSPRFPVPPEAGMQGVEEAAAAVRDAWGVPGGPIGNVLSLLERHGVVCVRYSLGQHNVDAFSVPFPERPVVVLGSDKEKSDRDRFTGSHELGHLVMHNLEHAGTKIVEQQAHRFAGAFLLPEADAREVLPTRPEWPELVRLKKQWGMSLGALLRRALDIDVMSENAYVQAMKYMSMRGWRRNEPGDIGPIESPRLLATAVQLSECTAADLATRTGWPSALVADLLAASTDPRPSVSW